LKRISGLLVLTLLAVAGCGGMEPAAFEKAEPRLVIEDYFAGETRAWGLFEDRFGRVRRQFTVDITGEWDGTELVLDERFHYSDGERERRVWRIRKIDEHIYEGTAGDVVGIARGTSYGNALHWRYAMDLRIGTRDVRVDFDDWMFLQPGGVLLNRARVSKWGIDIGEVTVAFVKPDAAMFDRVGESDEKPR